MRKTVLLLALVLLAGAFYAATAVVDLRPSQIDISSATSESAVLVTASGYTSDDARYRLYNGSNQYNCWNASTGTYITSTSYANGPQVPGTPSTTSTWWIMFQRGNNSTTAASYRDRLGSAYSTNYMTAALPAATSITNPVSITNANVSFSTWNTYTQKYVILAYDATTAGTLISATSSALDTGAFDLKVETGTIIHRIEVRDYLNNLIDSVTGTWPGSTPTPTIIVSGTLPEFHTYTGTPSGSESYTLSGSNLTGNIAVAALAGFEYSTDNSTWSSTLSLPSTYNGSVYVRLTGATAGSFSGNIVHSSAGAADVNLAVTGTVSDPAAQGLLLEENFAYTVGDSLTANGWIEHSTGINPILVVSGNLSYPSYVPLSGNMAVVANTGEDDSRIYTGQTSGSVYTAFLANITSASTTGDYFFHVSSNPLNTQQYRGRIYVKKDASNNLAFGIANAGAVGAAVFSDFTYSLNTTYLFLLKYEFVAGANNDVVKLWINPDFSGAEPAAQLTATDVITSEPENIGAIALRQGGSASGAAYKIDGIRVANDWATLWSGEAPPAPVISVTGTIDPLTSIVGIPSEELGQYQVDGTHLQGGITITAPPHFEVSFSATEGWATSLVASGTFPKTVYVRLNSTEVGQHAGLITHNSPGAAQVTIRVEGEVFAPTVTWNIPASLAAFSTVAGTPSAAVSYNLSATNATADLVITSQAPFELSANGTTGWGYELIKPYNFNGNVYVRFNPIGVGTYTGTINHNTTDATEGRISVSGTSTPPAGDYATDLFFSEYIEGSSNNKALEIFNGTGYSIDLANYKVILYSNGATAPGYTLTFPAGTMLAHNDVYVIANGSANATIQGLADTTSTVTFYNGDDALALVKISPDSMMVDIFGRIGEDPGTAWTADGGYSTAEKTLVRKPTITEGISVNPTAGFPTLATEWDVYAQDTTDFLGSHVFNPGTQIAAAPVLSPAGGLYTSPVNVSMSSTTPGATIYYTTDGSVPDNGSTPYTVPVTINANTTIKAITYAPGYAASSVTTEVYMFPITIPNIATLRAQATGTSVYHLTGEAVLTFQQAFRHQKYIQDATAAIVIDDPSGIITSTYNLYDGITGITGTLSTYSGLLQFVPVADPGPATSTNNVVVPAVRTLGSITSADQAKLLKVYNVTIDATLGTFPDAAANINVTDATATLVMRTFSAADYSGQPIPATPVDIVCLGGQFNETMQISPRFLSDFSPASGTLQAPIVAISEQNGQITISWAGVNGATSYRIEAADDPYGTYTVVTTTTNITWTGAATAKKFYRVIAIN